MNNISLCWCLSPNFGDALVPWLVERLGHRPVYFDKEWDGKKFFLGGSVLNWAKAGDVAWGCGVSHIEHRVAEGVEVRGTRGPLSACRAFATGVPSPHPAIGDAAMILPALLPVKINASRPLGIVPHYTDLYRVYARYPKANVISPLLPIEEFVIRIADCEVIASSALHGLVVAHAYGRKAIWVKFGDSILGDGTKYLDHLMSVRISPYSPVDAREVVVPESELYGLAVGSQMPSFGDNDRAALWIALPDEIRNGRSLAEVAS